MPGAGIRRLWSPAAIGHPVEDPPEPE